MLNDRRQCLAKISTVVDERIIRIFQTWGVVEVEVQGLAALRSIFQTVMVLSGVDARSRFRMLNVPRQLHASDKQDALDHAVSGGAFEMNRGRH